MYIFFEGDISGTVCLNKTGDTTETVQIMIQGGKLTTDREAVIAEVTKCIDDPMVFGICHYTYVLHWPADSGDHAVYSWPIPMLSLSFIFIL